ADSETPARLTFRSADELGGVAEAFNRLAEKLRQARLASDRRTRELEQANAELEAFSYSVSHDLRSPLRHITGYTDLLKREGASALSEKGLRYLDTISGAGRHLGALIEDLIVFSRIGRAEMRSETVDLGAVVARVRDRLASAVPDRRIEWRVE